MTLLQHTNLDTILMMIYCFVDDFLKGVVQTIHFALTRPTQHCPPTKKHNLSIAELASLAIFRFYTGHTDWKSFHAHLRTYHLRDFPKLPCYKNFLIAVNVLTPLASLLLSGFMHVFRSVTRDSDPKFTDGSKLRVCHIKREFSHKVCEGLATAAHYLWCLTAYQLKKFFEYAFPKPLLA